MIRGGGKGSTTLTGTVWETHTDFTCLLQPYYKIDSATKELIALEDGVYQNIFIVGKNALYEWLKKHLAREWKSILSTKLLPDEAIVNSNTKKVYIVEKKTQNTPGSVDEKLQTCRYKKQSYEKLFANTGYEVVFIYLLSEWFKKDVYKDVLQYIRQEQCHYFFGEIPTEELEKFLRISAVPRRCKKKKPGSTNRLLRGRHN